MISYCTLPEKVYRKSSIKPPPPFQRRKVNKPPGLYFSKALFDWLIFGGAYIRRGLSTEGNLRFKIDWASLIVERKFTVFALFYFVFEGNFQVQAPPRGGAYIRRGDVTEGFWRYEFAGLIQGGLIFGILRYFY